MDPWEEFKARAAAEYKWSTMAQWYHDSAKGGAKAAQTVVDHVLRQLNQRIESSASDPAWLPWYREHRQMIWYYPDGALFLGAEAIRRAGMSPGQRDKEKTEKRKPFIQEAMKGQEVTLLQKAKLAAIGYRGPAPADKAAASDLIDRIEAGKSAKSKGPAVGDEFDMSKALGELDAYRSDGTTLREFLCPICGDNFIHGEEPALDPGTDTAGSAWAGRGHLITVPFWCEAEQHRFEVCFGFHKGNTSIWCRYVGQEPEWVEE